MTDLIRLHGLRVDGRIGVTDEERAQPQTLIVDVDLEVDATKAGASDELDDTVDYSKVAATIERVVGDGEMKLLEHVAHRIAQEISPILGVQGVTVEVAKKAPMPQSHDKVSVRVERR